MSETHLTNKQLDRLPQYAQHEISRLAKDLEAAKAKLAAGPDGSDTFADPYGSPPRPLGTGTKVRFGGLGSNKTFDVEYAGGTLEVTGHRGSADRMAILPMVSNSISVTFVEQ